MSTSEAETRYDFGRNWSDYANTLTEERLGHAKTALMKLIPDVKGKSFMDIGSGSGLHSLAALEMGAEQVLAIDYDGQSVATTQALLLQSPNADKAACKQADILDLNSISHEEQFDIVYSWGVLHHTGDVWRALENAIKFVKPGGTLAIALYMRTPLCDFWKVEKQIYSGNMWVRPIIKYPFAATLVCHHLIRKGTSAASFVKSYEQDRGMSFMHDIDDWLGGYPYESVTDEEVLSFCTDRDLLLVKKYHTDAGTGIFGTGCGEWVFEKQGS